MKSKLSFFDPTLLRKNISRFSPAWALLLVLLVLTGPVPMLRELDETIPAVRRQVALNQFANDIPMGVFYAAGAAVLFAALVFKYLHKAQAAYMMHAFPMTRSCLFLTNAVSGLLFWAVPALLTVLLELAVLAAMNVGGCGAAAWAMLGKWLLAYLFFYGLAVFTMHISGSTVIAVLSYGALNFICFVLPVMVLLLVQLYFKGFDFEISSRILCLAPILALLREGRPDQTLLWIYAAVGLALTALAWVHYRFRQVERAGDPMAFAWARVAFRLVFTLCCALGLGWILTAFFEALSGNGEDGLFPFYAVLGCFLGWFGSSMMIERSVKVFRKKKIWLGFAAFAVVLLAGVLGLKYDALGFQRRVPDTADVASVMIWTKGDPWNDPAFCDCITLTERADIETVRDFHKAALSERERSDDGLYEKVHVCYRLKNGSTVRRAYATDEERCRSLAPIYARPELAAAWYEKALPEFFLRVQLYNGTEEMMWDGTVVESRDYYSLKRFNDHAALRSAILADAAAGRLPIINFITRNCRPGPDGQTPSESLPYLPPHSFCLEFEIGVPGSPTLDYRSIEICPEATDTLALFDYESPVR